MKKILAPKSFLIAMVILALLLRKFYRLELHFANIKKKILGQSILHVAVINKKMELINYILKEVNESKRKGIF